jgi:acyl carrier protein
MENKIKEIIATILDIEKKSLSLESGINDTPGWDSLKQMIIISAIEEELKITFEEEEIILLDNVQKILDSVNKKAV